MLAYLFDYKITKTKENIQTCGFPQKAISKVMFKLEQAKINYMMIDTRNNYDVDFKMDNRNLNNYEEIFEKASKHLKFKKRIYKISTELEKNIEKDYIEEMLKEVEEVVYANRKV